MKDRSVIELLVLVLTFTVGITLVGTGLIIGIIEIRNPETDTSTAANVLINMISTIMGALLGLLAGRSKFTEELTRHPHEKRDEDE